MAYTIGLVSDTHYPERCSELPPALFDVMRDVDMILHAGDVGELVVLDQLSECAPVTAVHGNDDTEESRRSLPYKTVVGIGGVRILLWHSHYEDRQVEFASRQGDEILPKLQRSADLAKEAGASVAVFGHWHIPLVHKIDGVTIVNPGAVASGNAVTRQICQSAARLTIDDGSVIVQHIDLAHPDKVFDPDIQWDDGFARTLDRFSASIFSTELLSELNGILGQISMEDQEKLRPYVYSLARRCWAGEFETIDMALMRTELIRTDTLSAEDKERFMKLIDG